MELIEDRQTSDNKQRDENGKGCSRGRNKLNESEKKAYNMRQRPVSGSEEHVNDVDVDFQS